EYSADDSNWKPIKGFRRGLRGDAEVLWDTTTVDNGDYKLRLKINYKDGTSLASDIQPVAIDNSIGVSSSSFSTFEQTENKIKDGAVVRTNNPHIIIDLAYKNSLDQFLGQGNSLDLFVNGNKAFSWTSSNMNMYSAWRDQKQGDLYTAKISNNFDLQQGCNNLVLANNNGKKFANINIKFLAEGQADDGKPCRTTCGCKSMQVRTEGESAQYDGYVKQNGEIRPGKLKLGSLKEETETNIKVGFSLEVVAEIEGDPDVCTEGQKVKSTIEHILPNGRNETVHFNGHIPGFEPGMRENPTAPDGRYPFGGEQYGDDDFNEPNSIKLHTDKTISWSDWPRSNIPKSTLGSYKRDDAFIAEVSGETGSCRCEFKHKILVQKAGDGFNVENNLYDINCG
ncbi:MAG TPA: hypothetical protein VJA47_02165, partial [archaeon]|nr:hypothetical protein [archaeon]